jgi:hypothetical protein
MEFQLLPHLIYIHAIYARCRLFLAPTARPMTRATIHWYDMPAANSTLPGLVTRPFSSLRPLDARHRNGACR